MLQEFAQKRMHIFHELIAQERAETLGVRQYYMDSLKPGYLKAFPKAIPGILLYDLQGSAFLEQIAVPYVRPFILSDRMRIKDYSINPKYVVIPVKEDQRELAGDRLNYIVPAVETLEAALVLGTKYSATLFLKGEKRMGMEVYRTGSETDPRYFVVSPSEQEYIDLDNTYKVATIYHDLQPVGGSFSYVRATVLFNNDEQLLGQVRALYPDYVDANEPITLSDIYQDCL